jgi:hypothetical protein
MKHLFAFMFYFQNNIIVLIVLDSGASCDYSICTNQTSIIIPKTVSTFESLLKMNLCISARFICSASDLLLHDFAVKRIFLWRK